MRTRTSYSTSTRSSTNPTSDATAILRAKDFGDLREFLQRHRPVNPQSASIPIYETKLTREGRHFAVRLLIFNDNSFEITLDNITAQEKNRLLKQEMTNNIAHELKPPSPASGDTSKPCCNSTRSVRTNSASFSTGLIPRH